MDRMVFTDRTDAGRRLAAAYEGPREDVVALGIARGGVPVAYELAVALRCELEVITARKLPIPWSPEAGFGAVAPDGSRVLNPDITPQLGLSQREIDSITDEVLAEVKRREQVYRGGRPMVALKGRNALLVDDGLATGITMVASIEMMRKQGAASVNVAVPVSPADTARRIRSICDYFLCLHVDQGFSFAVASFYRDFHDMRDSEVLDYLERARPHAPGANPA